MIENAKQISETHYQVKLIHDSQYRIVLTITGGGTEAIGELLRHGEGSDTLLEAMVPYSPESLEELIGKKPNKYASAETAKEMAMIAYRRALFLASQRGNYEPEILIGIGVTCKLTKIINERKARDHEVHFACQSYNKTGISSIILNNNTEREEQEKAVAEFIIKEIANICDPKSYIQEGKNKKEIFKKILKNKAEADIPVANLLLKTLEGMNSKNYIAPLKVDMGIKDNRPRVILSGSFNPCHKNHLAMARIASEKYNCPVDFEISLANVDKPPIDFISLEQRIDSILKYHDNEYIGNIYLSNSPLFADKAVLFPNCVFLIGTDTLNRLFNIKYYRSGEDKQSLLDHFKNYHTRFMVFQRKDAFISSNMEIPEICEIVPLSSYKDDGTSSTKIRDSF